MSGFYYVEVADDFSALKSAWFFFTLKANISNWDYDLADLTDWLFISNGSNDYEGLIKRLDRNEDSNYIRYFVSDDRLEELKDKNVYLELASKNTEVKRSLTDYVDKCSLEIPFHEAFSSEVGDEVFVFLSGKDGVYFQGKLLEYEEEDGIMNFDAVSWAYDLMKVYKTKMFRNWKPEKIVEGLVESNSSMTVSYVATGESIPKFPVKDYVWDIVKKLAEGYKYQLRIEGKTLYYEPKGHITSSLDIDKDIVRFKKASYDSEKVVNDLYMRTGENTYDTYYSDGSASSGQVKFTVNHPISGGVRVLVDSTEKSASSYEIDKEGGYIEFDSGLSGGETVEIYYQYEAPTTIHIDDSTSMTKYGTRSEDRREDWLRDLETAREFAFEYLRDNKDADWDVSAITEFKRLIQYDIQVGKKYKVKHPKVGLNKYLICKEIKINSSGSKGGQVGLKFGTIRRDIIDWNKDVNKRIRELEKQIEADILVSEYRRWTRDLDVDFTPTFDIDLTANLTSTITVPITPTLEKYLKGWDYDRRFRIGVDLLSTGLSGSVVPNRGIVLWLTMAEENGSYVRDRSGFGNDGTISALGLHTVDSVNLNLTNNNEWDSGWHLVETYNRLRFSVYSDKSVRIAVKWSNNGSDMMAESDSVSSTAGTGEGRDYPNVDKYAKLIVRNESGATAVLRAALNGSYVRDRLSGALWVDGYMGKALSFDGTNDYVKVPDSSSLNFTEGITITVWAKTDSWNDGTWRSLVDKKSASDADGYRFNKRGDGTIYFECGNGDDELILYSDSTPSDGVWNYLTATYDSEVLKIYINGVLDNEVANSTGITGNTRNLLFGGAHTGNNFNGKIDEVRIYNRALSKNEIEDLYNNNTT